MSKEKTPTEKALTIAFDCGQIDGDHSKMWVIDQMVRALLGDDYQKEIDRYEDVDENGHREYEWNCGIAP